jgi:hypothetical protein
MAEKKLQTELTRLHNKQNNARQDEVFGGFSDAEQTEYDENAERIHELERERQGEATSDDRVQFARRQWNKDSETDTPQSEAHQPYRSRDKLSMDEVEVED